MSTYDLEDVPFDKLMLFIEENMSDEKEVYRGKLADFDARFVSDIGFIDEVLMILKKMDLISRYSIIHDFGNRRRFDKVSVGIKNK